MTAPTKKLVSKSELDDIITFHKMKGHYIVAGSQSIFVRNTNTKYIDVKHCQTWPDLNGELVPMTSGEIVRTEVRREHPDKPIRKHYKSDAMLLDTAPPMVYLETWKGYGCHIDLTAAYWNIYKFLTLDFSYPRSMGRYHLGKIAERLKDNKKARNSIIGMSRGGEATTWRGYNRGSVRISSPLYCPDLWHFVMCIMNELALIAVGCGAIYVNTDGYIFKEGGQVNFFKRMLALADLPYRVGWGDVDIKGWNAYKSPERERGTQWYNMPDYHYGKNEILFNILIDRRQFNDWRKFPKNLEYFILQKDKQNGFDSIPF